MLRDGIGSTSSFASETTVTLTTPSVVLSCLLIVCFSLLFPWSAGHSQASSSSIADGTASGSQAQVHSKQHTSSTGQDSAKADVTNSVDGKNAIVSFQSAGASDNSP